MRYLISFHFRHILKKKTIWISKIVQKSISFILANSIKSIIFGLCCFLNKSFWHKSNEYFVIYSEISKAKLFDFQKFK